LQKLRVIESGVIHQCDTTQFTAVRNVQRANRSYRVWIRRGPSIAVHVYEAASGEAAIAQARAELELVENLLSAI
jgi:hypothetical protein